MTIVPVGSEGRKRKEKEIKTPAFLRGFRDEKMEWFILCKIFMPFMNQEGS